MSLLRKASEKPPDRCRRGSPETSGSFIITGGWGSTRSLARVKIPRSETVSTDAGYFHTARGCESRSDCFKASALLMWFLPPNSEIQSQTWFCSRHCLGESSRNKLAVIIVGLTFYVQHFCRAPLKSDMTTKREGLPAITKLKWFFPAATVETELWTEPECIFHNTLCTELLDSPETTSS